MDYDEIDMSELSEVNSITEVNETGKTDYPVDSDLTSTDLESMLWQDLYCFALQISWLVSV